MIGHTLHCAASEVAILDRRRACEVADVGLLHCAPGGEHCHVNEMPLIFSRWASKNKYWRQEVWQIYSSVCVRGCLATTMKHMPRRPARSYNFLTAYKGWGQSLFVKQAQDHIEQRWWESNLWLKTYRFTRKDLKAGNISELSLANLHTLIGGGIYLCRPLIRSHGGDGDMHPIRGSGTCTAIKNLANYWGGWSLKYLCCVLSRYWCCLLLAGLHKLCHPTIRDGST